MYIPIRQSYLALLSSRGGSTKFVHRINPPVVVHAIETGKNKTHSFEISLSYPIGWLGSPRSAPWSTS